MNNLLLVTNLNFPISHSLLKGASRYFSKNTNQTYILKSDLLNNSIPKFKNRSSECYIFSSNLSKNKTINYLRIKFLKFYLLCKLCISKKFSHVLVRNNTGEALLVYFLSIIFNFKLIYHISFPTGDKSMLNYGRKLSTINFNLLVGKIHNFLMPIIYKLYTSTYVISNAMKEDLNERFNMSETRILPLGVDMNYYDKVFSSIEKANFSRDTKRIIYAGTLDPTRRLEILLHAFKQVLSENKVKLIIVGAGQSSSH